MRWFQYTINDFEESYNPPNAGFVVMERTGKHVSSAMVPNRCTPHSNTYSTCCKLPAKGLFRAYAAVSRSGGFPQRAHTRLIVASAAEHHRRVAHPRTIPSLHATAAAERPRVGRSEEHTSELQSLMT